MAGRNDVRVKIGADTTSVQAALNRTVGQFDAASRRMQDAGGRIAPAFAGPFSSIERDLGRVTVATERLTRAMSLLGISVAGLGVAGFVRITTDWEAAVTELAKTVDASDESLAALSRRFQQLSEQIPVSASELTRLGAAAGQLGVATPAIDQFVQVMAALGVSSNLSADEAATALARLANITQLPQDQFDRLGSTIVALGNNLATTEKEIVEMALRLAGAGAQIGLTEAEILSFAGALSSVGIEAEAGGTAFSRVFVEIANAAASGGDNLEAFAKVAGQSADEFASLFRNDAASAITEFVEGLARLSDEGENVFAVLGEVGADNVRIRDALLRAANAGDLLRESIDLGNRAWEENTALTNEAGKFYDTLGGDIQRLRNELVNLASSTGQAATPALRVAAQAATELISVLDVLAKSTVGGAAIGLSVALGRAAAGFVASTTAALNAARADALLAKAELDAARAAFSKGVALRDATAASTGNAIATVRLANAEAAYTLAASRASLATVALGRSMAGLRTAMAFLTGPVGIALTAAAAIASLSLAFRDSTVDTDRAREAVDKYRLALEGIKDLDFANALGRQRELETRLALVQSAQRRLAELEAKGNPVSDFQGDGAGITPGSISRDDAEEIKRLRDYLSNNLSVQELQEALDETVRHVEKLGRQRPALSTLTSGFSGATGEADKLRNALGTVSDEILTLQRLSGIGVLRVGEAPQELQDAIRLVDEYRDRVSRLVSAVAELRAAGAPVPEGTAQALTDLRAGLASAETSLADVTARFEDLVRQTENYEPRIAIRPTLETPSLQSFEDEFRATALRLRQEFVSGAISLDEFEAQGQAAADRFLGALERAGALTPEIRASVVADIDGTAMLAHLQRAFDRTNLELKEDLARGLVDESEFEKQGQAAAIAFRDGLLAVLKALRDSGGLTEELETQVIEMIANLDIEIPKIDGGREFERAASDVVGGLADIGDAFGFLGTSSRQALSGVSGLVRGISDLQSASGPLAQLGAAFGIGGAIAQLGASIFGESPRERELRDALRSNEDAILKLRNTIDGLRSTLDRRSVVGEAALAASQDSTLRTRLTQSGGQVAGVRIPNRDEEILGEFLKPFGISVREFSKIAEDAGITLWDSTGNVIIPAFEQLAEIMGLSIENLTRYNTALLDDFTKLQNARRAIFDEDDAVSAAEDQLARLAEFAPKLFGDLADIDLDTDEGRQAFEDRIREVFEGLASVEGLSVEEFGTFDKETLLEALLGADSALDALASSADKTAKALGDVNVPQGFRIVSLELERFNAQRALTAEEADAIVPRPSRPAAGEPALPQLPPPVAGGPPATTEPGLPTRPRFPEAPGVGAPRERPRFETDLLPLFEVDQVAIAEGLRATLAAFDGSLTVSIEPDDAALQAALSRTLDLVDGSRATLEIIPFIAPIDEVLGDLSRQLSTFEANLDLTLSARVNAQLERVGVTETAAAPADAGVYIEDHRTFTFPIVRQEGGESDDQFAQRVANIMRRTAREDNLTRGKSYQDPWSPD